MYWNKALDTCLIAGRKKHRLVHTEAAVFPPAHVLDDTSGFGVVVFPVWLVIRSVFMGKVLSADSYFYHTQC